MTSSAPDPGVEPDQHPEVPSPDAGRESVMPNRHPGQAAQTPGSDDDQDSGPATTPDAPGPHPDPDPDPVTPPSPVPNPQPDDPSVST